MKALVFTLIGLAAGLVTGYTLGVGGGPQTRVATAYRLPVAYGDLGPELLAAGSLDLERFAASLDASGAPLSENEIRILRQGADDPIEIGRANALFLLNLFWAVGLTNQNEILTRGPMVRAGIAQVGRYASTGGWTLGSKSSNELYASAPLIPLTGDQQARLLRVAAQVFRPCCDNPAAFPDCNHGMAMLGMLTLLAANGATESQMFEAAAAANGVWYPQQYRELEIYAQAVAGDDGRERDPRTLVGYELASGTGFQDVHRRLVASGLLDTAPGAEGSAC